MTITEQNIPTNPAELRRFAAQMLTGLTELEDKHVSLEARHKAEIQNRDMMITKLRHQLFGLRKDKFGSSGEGLDQLGLRLEDEETGQEQKAASLETGLYTICCVVRREVCHPMTITDLTHKILYSPSPPDVRVAMRQQHSKYILADLESWLSNQLTHISGKSPLAGAIRYALTRIPKVRPYLEHGFLELDNNTAERAMRPIAIGRKNYLFLGSEKGGKSAAICYSLIETCKLNGVNPQSWLTRALTNIQDIKLSDLDKLLPWNYIEGS